MFFFNPHRNLRLIPSNAYAKMEERIELYSEPLLVGKMVAKLNKNRLTDTCKAVLSDSGGEGRVARLSQTFKALCALH